MEVSLNKDERPNLLKSFFSLKESGVIIPVVLLTVAVACINPTFITPDNIINNILRSSSFSLITALGMTFVMISGGIDLSVGSMMGLGGVVAGLAMQAGLPIFIGILLGLLVGAFFGLINGMAIVKFNLAPLMMTLGTQYVARGIIYIVTEGAPVYPLPIEFQKLEQNSILGVPTICWVAILLAALMLFILTQTRFGRATYAIGGNAESARLSGINVGRTKCIIYSMTGALAAITGIFMASRLGSAQAGYGQGNEMMIIAAVVIGGTSTFGGVGTVLGTIIGVLFVNILSNSMTLLKISMYWQTLVIGLILILAVLLDGYKRKRSSAS